MYQRNSFRAKVSIIIIRRLRFFITIVILLSLLPSPRRPISQRKIITARNTTYNNYYYYYHPFVARACVPKFTLLFFLSPAPISRYPVLYIVYLTYLCFVNAVLYLYIHTLFRFNHFQWTKKRKRKIAGFEDE